MSLAGGIGADGHVGRLSRRPRHRRDKGATIRGRHPSCGRRRARGRRARRRPGLRPAGGGRTSSLSAAALAAERGRADAAMLSQTADQASHSHQPPGWSFRDPPPPRTVAVDGSACSPCSQSAVDARRRRSAEARRDRRSRRPSSAIVLARPDRRRSRSGACCVRRVSMRHILNWRRRRCGRQQRGRRRRLCHWRKEYPSVLRSPPRSRHPRRTPLQPLPPLRRSSPAPLRRRTPHL